MKFEDLKHFFIIPIIIGIIGGASALLFRRVIDLFAYIHNLLNVDHWQYFHLITMPLIFFFSHILITKMLKNPSNVTIEEIAKKISLMVGKFSLLKGFLVLLITSISIGFGVPVGREGPIAKLGGLFSEVFIKLFKIERINIPIYLSAGVSSAISATFNAPIAGIFFGIEIIIGKINSYIVIPLIVASVTATLFAREYIGYYTAFYVPHLHYNDEYFWFIPLGALFFTIIALFLKLSFRKLRQARAKFRKVWRYIVIFMGLFVGIIITLVPEARGVGYEFVSRLFNNEFYSYHALLIAVAKFLAVALSIGSGLFGGVMSPSIFLGAFSGYWFGSEFASFGFDPRVFALIGSAAVLAGISKAPMRSSIIITELTHSYQLLLPILLSSAISVFFLSRLEPGSYFKRALLQKGIDVDDISIRKYLQECDVTRFIYKVPTLKENDFIEKAAKIFRKKYFFYLPVVDEKDILIGIVSLRDIRKRALIMSKKKLLVKDIMSKKPFVIHKNSSNDDIFKAISILNVTQIPFVDEEGKYVGMLDLNRFLKELSLCKLDYKIR